MAKRKAFVHIGLDDGSGDVIDPALRTHRRALAELGVCHPADSGEEMFRAALEVLGTDREWGYAREEVEGAWTGVVRRGLKGRDALVFSQTLLAGASPEQASLVMDALDGFQAHVVLTVQAPDAWTVPGEPAQDLGSVLDRWAGAVRKPERLHVIVAGDRGATWKAFGRVVGFGTASLRVGELVGPTKPRPPQRALAERAAVLHTLGQSWRELLATSPFDVVGDPDTLVPDLTPAAPGDAGAAMATTEHALHDALRDVERLTHRNEFLELRLAKVEKKRRKLKRRLEVETAS